RRRDSPYFLGSLCYVMQSVAGQSCALHRVAATFSPGQSHQQGLCLLLYHGGLCVFSALCLFSYGMLRMETPNAIDQMFAYFAVVHASRRQHPTTLHPLEAMITMTILATICGAHNWVKIEQWGLARHPWLAECLALQPGIPSHDTFG